MIAEKDASKSDERHVKDRRNTNLLTQKKTGGKHIMGNRGMTNWKLGAFFVMSLMLVAAVFSNTAMAAADDGAGTIAVQTIDSEDDSRARTVVVTDTFSDDAIAAGSRFNALQFTYMAFKDVAGTALDGGGIDIPGMVDANDTGINMAGGRLRISFPGGWTVSNKLVQVQDGGSTIYQTDGMGRPIDFATVSAATPTLIADLDEDSEKAMNAATVTLTDSSITINFSSGWASRTGEGQANAGRSIAIIFSDVQAGLTSGPTITFPTSSSARNGNLKRLKPQDPVTVANILGTRTPAYVTEETVATVADRVFRADPLDRVLDITPAKVYPGEEHLFTITFDPPGPMAGATLAITVPENLQPTNFEDGLDDGAGTDVNVLGASATIDGNIITVILGDRKVTITYMATVNSNAVAANVFEAMTTISPRNPTSVTKVDGGVVGAVEGSGKMELSPTAVEAGDSRSFTLTYTAATDLTVVNIRISPSGIHTADPDKTADMLHEGTSSSDSSYGAVSGVTSHTTDEKGSLDTTMLPSGVIQWTGVSLKKDHTLTIYVNNVKITDRASKYQWETRVSGTNGVDPIVTAETAEIEDDMATEDVNEVTLHTLYVEDTENDGIVFEIDGESEATYNAASKQTIIFTFTAETTPIRDGEVSFAIPGGWDPPKPASSDAKTKGMIAASVPAADGLIAKTDGDKRLPIIDGQTIRVKLDRLNKGGVVTIKYGTDPVGEAQVQTTKPSTGKITIDGRFRTSSSSRSAGTVTVNIENVGDGTGSAEITTSESIEAGSNDGQVQVKFTAAGTMDGGKVSLEVPAGWGTPQTDPTKQNYIVATPNSYVSGLEVQGDTAIATISRLGPSNSIYFTYGGGTGGDNNGVVVQDNIIVAKFTVSSDGDGDDLFELVQAENKFEDLSASDKARNEKMLRKLYSEAGHGVLQIDVVSATGGTGLAAVDPAKVRAAATDVKLTFTYTPSRTIRDGKLKFTVPSTGAGTWSPPQVENAGSPGFTEVEWERGFSWNRYGGSG